MPYTRSIFSVRIAALIGGALCIPAAWGADPMPLVQAARSIVGANQGVYVEAADGTVLVARAAELPVHPASVSKIATTIALLNKFGIEHRFTTVFSASGKISNGTLEGDLVVEADGDPYFVDENALLVAERLREAGVQRVTGTLRTRGALTFDWDIDPDGVRLRRALSGGVPAAAWTSVQSLDGGANNAGESVVMMTAPVIQFANSPSVVAAAAERKLVIHRSQPLLSLTKSLNDYSNNIFKPLADAAGGAPAVEAVARAAVPAIMQAEIIMGDGAGTDPGNRFSPRAAVSLLRVLERQLASSGHALCDILPVSGIDEGTLRKRLDGPGEAGHVVGKTGTFGDYGASALVGAIATAEQGTVYFAILNHDVPVPVARLRQDRFVRALLAHFHTQPWRYQPDLRPAVARAEAEIVTP